MIKNHTKKFQHLKNTANSLALTAAVALPNFAHAADGDIDVSATITRIGTANTAVLAIGVAVTTIFVGVKLYKWVQRAL